MVRAHRVRSAAFGLIAGLATVGFAARSQAGEDQAAIAAAAANVPAALEEALQSATETGKPISAKFEIEDGQLQLSIYVDAPHDFAEIVMDPRTGGSRLVKRITDPDDLKDAKGQKAAMDKATVSLLSATQKTLGRHAGARALSVFPELRQGHPVALITFVENGRISTAAEGLD